MNLGLSEEFKVLVLVLVLDFMLGAHARLGRSGLSSVLDAGLEEQCRVANMYGGYTNDGVGGRGISMLAGSWGNLLIPARTPSSNHLRPERSQDEVRLAFVGLVGCGQCRPFLQGAV